MAVVWKKIIFLLALFTVSAWAKTFNTDYIEFQLPPGWQCSLEGTEWVCQGENKERQKEAIIIMAAKEKGSQDGIEQYYAYLKEKKQYVLPNRKTQVSDPKYTKKSKVNEQLWVDSLHLASEVPGFYTRYMATIKGGLGIAVTFSVSKEHYDSYQQVFQKIIESIRVFAVTKGQMAKTLGLKKTHQDLLAGKGLVGLGNFGKPRVVGSQPAKPGGDGDMLLYLILGAAVAGFIVYKKKKKG